MVAVHLYVSLLHMDVELDVDILFFIMQRTAWLPYFENVDVIIFRDYLLSLFCSR